VVRLDVKSNVCLWSILVWRRLQLGNRWSPETVLCLGHGRLLRRDKCGGHHFGADCLWVHVVAGAGQLALLVEVVVVKFVDAASVTFQLFAHREVGASLAKGRTFLVGGGRRCGYLLMGLILQAVNVQLLHNVAAKTYRPTFRTRNLWTESARLGQVTHG